MEGYEVKFNLYAESQEDADEASKAIKDFVSGMAQKGIAVTAKKIACAVRRWGDNVFVNSYFK